ncbi:MAG: hypothetical protein IJU77_08775 [Butyrivibrio sp.]|nr:hypothetical protein [Butyrivibrio sp.]
MNEIIDIMDLNRSEYEALLGGDISENMDRAFFNGIISRDEADKEPNGAVVWYLHNAESKRDTTSIIVCFIAPDADTAGELLDEYIGRAEEDMVKKTTFELEDLSDEIRDVLVRRGFKVEEKESSTITVTFKDAADSKIMQKTNVSANIRAVNDLSLIQFRQAITSCLFIGESGLYDDLSILPKNWYEEDISCCSIIDNKVRGVLLMHSLPSGILKPVLLFANGDDANINILHMLRFCVQKGVEIYPEDKQVLITRNSKRVQKLMEALFPKITGKTVFAGELVEVS